MEGLRTDDGPIGGELERLAKNCVHCNRHPGWTPTQFLGQAEKCLLIQRLGNAVQDADWGTLGTMLGSVITVFDIDESSNAQEAVNCLRDSTCVGGTATGARTELLDKAQLRLEMFSDATHRARDQA